MTFNLHEFTTNLTNYRMMTNNLLKFGDTLHLLITLPIRTQSEGKILVIISAKIKGGLNSGNK
jgi:hypothetical protein